MDHGESPAHQRYFVSFSPPRFRCSFQSPLRRASNILRNTPFYPEHATGEGASDLRGARPYLLAHDPLARYLANHPHPPTYRDIVIDCCGREGFGEGPEPPLLRRSTLRARSASCRKSCTRCSRKACGSQWLGGCVGRSSLNRGRAFASL